jgi:hypothetical protein
MNPCPRPLDQPDLASRLSDLVRGQGFIMSLRAHRTTHGRRKRRRRRETRCKHDPRHTRHDRDSKGRPDRSDGVDKTSATAALESVRIGTKYSSYFYPHSSCSSYPPSALRARDRPRERTLRCLELLLPSSDTTGAAMHSVSKIRTRHRWTALIHEYLLHPIPLLSPSHFSSDV